MSFVQVQVDAYSGFRANERPLAFELEGVRHEVAEVGDRWYEGGRTPKDQRLDYFKVRTVSGREFILRYNALFDVWSVLLTAASNAADPQTE